MLPLLWLLIELLLLLLEIAGRLATCVSCLAATLQHRASCQGGLRPAAHLRRDHIVPWDRSDRELAAWAAAGD